MTEEFLMNVINELHNVGYLVISCVIDCGGGTMNLWKKIEYKYK